MISVVDLKKHFNNDVQIDIAKAKLINMGFAIEEINNQVLVKSSDKDQMKLLYMVNLGSMSMLQLLLKAGELSEKPDKIANNNNKVVKKYNLTLTGNVQLPLKDVANIPGNYAKTEEVQAQTDRISCKTQQFENKIAINRNHRI